MCPALDDPHSMADACFLVGTYLILYRGAPYDNVLATFRNSHLIQSVKDRPGLCKAETVDSWRSLHRAVRLGWFVAPGSNAEPMMDVQELTHYSRRANSGCVLQGRPHVSEARGDAGGRS